MHASTGARPGRLRDDGDELWEKCLFTCQGSRCQEMGSVEHRRRDSNPLVTVLEAVPLPKLADKN